MCCKCGFQMADEIDIAEKICTSEQSRCDNHLLKCQRRRRCENNCEDCQQCEERKNKLVKAISFSVERSFPVTRGMEELRFSWPKAAGIGSIRQKPPSRADLELVVSVIVRP